MFDFSFGELLLFAVIALVVLGPEKLPHAARMAGAYVGLVRRSMMAIQAEIEQEVAAQEMRQRLEKEMARARDSEAAQQLRDAGQTIHEALQPPLMTGNPPPELSTAEKPGEDAFKAYVQGHTPAATPVPPTHEH